MSDLDKLIAAVEAAADEIDMFPAIPDMQHRHWFAAAYNGDLNAALRLHEALLPGWHLSELSQAPDPSEYPGLDWVAVIADRGSPKSVESCAPNPARAWLLAILRALAAHEQADARREGGE